MVGAADRSGSIIFLATRQTHICIHETYNYWEQLQFLRPRFGYTPQGNRSLHFFFLTDIFCCCFFCMFYISLGMYDIWNGIFMSTDGAIVQVSFRLRAME